MKKAKALLKNKLKCQRGMASIEIMMIVVMTIIIAFTGINVIIASIKAGTVSDMAEHLARRIEVEGAVNDSVYEAFDKMKHLANLPQATFEVRDVHYFNTMQRTIQLKDTFTVRVSAEYELKILDPSMGDPLIYKVPLVKDKAGMSEVYHKP